MNKVVRDGKVAVMYSPGFGAGWYTWNGYRSDNSTDFLFDPGLVSLLESGSEYEKLEAYCTLKWPDAYLGGLDGLKIEWIPIGTEFRIDEYDGSETILIKDQLDWVTA